MPMTTIQVQSQLSFDKLLGSLPQLSSEELAQLAQHATRIEVQRKVGSLSEAEADLLLKINQGVVPPDWQQRCAKLTAKARAGTITDAEHAKLVNLVDEIEQLNAKRLDYLVQLAQIRGVTLDELMGVLELAPLAYE
jgi:hypothetical protein